MNRADELAAEYLIRQVPEEPFTGPMPRCVVEPIAEGPSDYVSPLEAVAGFAVVAVVALIFGWVL